MAEDTKVVEFTKCSGCGGNVFTLLYHIESPHNWVSLALECHTCKKWKSIKGEVNDESL